MPCVRTLKRWNDPFRVSELDLAIVIGKEPSLRALEHAEFATLEASGLTLRNDAISPGFDADHAHFFVAKEGVQHAHHIRAATDARDEQVGQPLFPLPQTALQCILRAR